jgi:predicted metal-dependent peptidase
MKPNEQLFMMAQQVLRCILFHFSRRGQRDVKKWNVAGTIVVNNMLVAEQMGEVPKGEPVVPEFNDLSTEQVYLKLKEMQEQQKKKQPSGGNGCVMDAPKGDEKEDGDENGEGKWSQGTSPEQLEMNWKVALEQASLQMQKRGLGSANMDRVLNEARKSQTDWRDRIRQFLTVAGDSTWAKPNRRYIGRGMVLPSVKKSRLGHIVFAIDTSGSIDEAMLSKFSGEINEILHCAEEWPERVSVMWADCSVLAVEDQEGEVVLRPKGGGGTAFQPTFDWIKDNDWEPQVMFYLTDLCGDSPKNPSTYPVVWVVPEEYKEQYGRGVKWGDLVVIEK